AEGARSDEDDRPNGCAAMPAELTARPRSYRFPARLGTTSKRPAPPFGVKRGPRHCHRPILETVPRRRCGAHLRSSSEVASSSFWGGAPPAPRTQVTPPTRGGVIVA